MAGSTFGTLYTITTWGESHGPALGVVVDGCPAGIPLTSDHIQTFALANHQYSYNPYHEWRLTDCI